MTHQEIDVDNLENVGMFDRANRIILGITSITVAVAFTAIPEAAIVSLVAVGIYTGLTAFIGWDPLYALAKASQQRPPVQTPPTVNQRRDEHHSIGGYEKAA